MLIYKETITLGVTMLTLDDLQELNVLYVEDDDITREMAFRMLSKYFKTVTPAPDGKAGLEVYSDIKPDIIITDLSMPEMSGFEMIDRIRESDLKTPIIVTTAYRSEAEALENVNDIVFKPVNKKVLLQAVMQLEI